MRQLTRKEFEEMVITEYAGSGLTEEEIDHYYFFYKLGRTTVRM